MDISSQEIEAIVKPVWAVHRQAPPLQPIPLHPAVQQATAACSRT